MQHRNWSLLGLSAMSAAAISVNLVASAGAKQEGQPAATPRPANSQPAPANAQPNPANSQPGAADPAAQPPVVRPSLPTQPQQKNPGAAIGRYQRPFAFTSPQVEARFTESARQLAGMEQRLGRSNQDLLKRLGEVRGLAPEKQNAALLDILQQSLMEQAQMQKYMVQSRTVWSGDLDLPTTEANAGQSENFPTDATGPNSPNNMRMPPEVPPR